MKRLTIQLVLAALVCTIFSACGDPQINAAKNEFEPKIVIQGYLFPEKPVEIILTRNFALQENNPFSVFDLIIENAAATISDLTENKVYHLSYDPNALSYKINENELIIDYGKTYRLDVEAEINGKRLSAHSTTTVPQQGFAVVESESRLGVLKYREKDENGDVKKFEIAYTRSENIEIYIESILALDASTSTFVYDNPFYDHDTSDVNFFFKELVSRFEWAQNQPKDPLQEPVISRQEIQWISLPFYGRYRAIVYAAERNFKDFFLTHSTIQTIDGNFFEPSFHINGDGIGIFGAAIADTVYFEVSR